MFTSCCATNWAGVRLNRPDSELLSMDEKIAAACRNAAEQAISRAENTGTHVIVWRDGQILRLTAADARAELEKNRDVSDKQEATGNDG